MTVRSFKDLMIWQKARDLALKIYKITDNFPVEEKFGLTQQMRRSAVSVSSNIAEGFHRPHPKEKKQFMFIAFSSAAELESQLELVKNLYSQLDYSEVEDNLIQVKKILGTMLYR